MEPVAAGCGAAGTGPPNRAQQIRAALAYAGRATVLTGCDAAKLHGAHPPPGQHVHVLVPHDRRRLSTGFVLVERTRRLPMAVVRDGVPVAPVARAVLDAVRRMQEMDQVRAALADAVQRSLATPGQLLAELDAGSGRGSALPREVLRHEIGAGVHSVAEADALGPLSRTELPAARWNVDVFTADGRFLGRPDAWFDDVALAWQIDSYQFHLAPADYARTMDRDAVMVAEGIVVLRTLPTDLRRRPALVLRRLRAAYHQAAARPRPLVQVRRTS